MILTKKKLLGTILVSMGLITEEQLIAALNRSTERELLIGDYFLKYNLINAEDLAKSLALQYEIEYFDPTKCVSEKEAIDLVPKSTAKEFSILPLKMEDDNLLVGVNDPSVLIRIQQIITTPFKIVAISKESFAIGFSNAYEKNENIKQILKKITDDKKSTVSENKNEKITVTQQTSSVEKLVNDFIAEAVRAKASDIHVEVDDDVLRVRTRVDGVLIEREHFPIDLHSTIVSRIKLIAGLDITEKRIPQDGRINLSIGNRDIDLRVSTLPMIKGEKVVLRILDKSSINVDLNSLGIDDKVLNDLKEILHASSGIILVTGPTGSGKTTTVYSMLNFINTIDINIISVEDPVEYNFKLINQVQVNTKAGLTFSGSLRSILRQDPDVIMIGEIRDAETAEIAIKAALTGHLVVSTLHTNDAISAIQRLTDIGVEPYLVSSAILGVVAQRLVRRVCPQCVKEITDINLVTNEIDQEIIKSGGKALKAVGCEACFKTGYKGRLPIFELFIPDNEMRMSIKNKMSDIEMTRIAHDKLHFRAMYVDGIDKIKKRLTTSDEVLKQVSGTKRINL